MTRLDYFPHDTNARHDPALKRMQIDLGAEMAIAWWPLVEVLHGCGGCYEIRDDVDVLILGDEIGLAGTITCRTFLDYCANAGLIQPELYAEGKVMSDRVSRNIQLAESKKRAGSAGGKSRKSA